MNRTPSWTRSILLLAGGIAVVTPLAVMAAGTSPAATSAAGSQTEPKLSKDRWLHVRVINADAKGETVRVNIPLDLAERVLPTISKERIHDGKISFDEADIHDVDLRAMLDAVRNAKDGEYVSIQGGEQDVHVSKQGGHLLVHVVDKTKKDKPSVDIKIPMKVVDALFSAGKDELNVLAALHALGEQGDTELVSVKSQENTVRVWLDSKNAVD